MRAVLISMTVLAGLAGGPVFAQPVTPQGVPPGANPETGARPGNPIGTKESLPRGNNASNINEEDKRSDIAPNLPTPRAGDEASAADYLQNAQTALRRGQTGEAQEALERAETRLLDDQQVNGQQPTNPAIQKVHDARQALGSQDRAQAEQMIEDALNSTR